MYEAAHPSSPPKKKQVDAYNPEKSLELESRQLKFETYGILAQSNNLPFLLKKYRQWEGLC